MSTETTHASDVASTRRPRRLAVVTSHPIQYQAPLFRELAKRPDVDLTVFFCSDHGVTEQVDPGFGRSFKWDVPLLDGYRHEFVPNVARHPGPTGFFGEINPALVGKLARGKFDAVLVHGYAFASCWLAGAGAKLGGAKLLLRGESHLLEPRPRWKRFAKRLLLGPAFRFVDACLPIGSLNYEYYRSYGVSPLKLIYAPYTVDNDFFAREADRWRPRRNEVRRELGLPEDAAVALFSAKLLPKKRPLDLLKALEATRTAPAIRALFVGDGPLRSECEAFARTRLAGRVAFAGFRNQTDLPRLYAAADVLVLPSDVEPWGLVLNEAMAAGLPVIASAVVGAAADLVRPGETGEMFRLGDIAALAGALDKVCEPATAARLSAGARARIARWSIRETADGIARALHA